MFNSLDRRFVGHEASLELLPATEVRHPSRNFETTEVSPLEPDTVTSGSRPERQRHFLPGVEPDSSTRNRAAKGTLS